MEAGDALDWADFIRDYPGMKLRPQPHFAVAFKGSFKFRAVLHGQPEVKDSYDLSIFIPTNFPRDLPVIIETGNRIPRDGKHHTNPDGTLCLGAPLRLLVELSKKPTLVGFSEKCLVPYLYAMSRNLNDGIPFSFGELEHGSAGEFKDYAELFGLRSPDQAKQAISLLGMKERCANKHPCPCGCGRRLGLCNFRNRLIEIRQLASLDWFRAIARKS